MKVCPSVSLYDEVQAAVAAVGQASDVQPVVGVVLGSGLGAFAECLDEREAVSYQDIPHFPTSGVSGHAGQLVLGKVGGVSCAVMR